MHSSSEYALPAFGLDKRKLFFFCSHITYREIHIHNYIVRDCLFFFFLARDSPSSDVSLESATRLGSAENEQSFLQKSLYKDDHSLKTFRAGLLFNFQASVDVFS